MPQFQRQTARPLRPASYRASARRGRELLDLIERYADPQDVREKQQLTRAIHGLSAWAQALSSRHRAQTLSHVEDLRRVDGSIDEYTG